MHSSPVLHSDSSCTSQPFSQKAPSPESEVFPSNPRKHMTLLLGLNKTQVHKQNRKKTPRLSLTSSTFDHHKLLTLPLPSQNASEKVHIPTPSWALMAIGTPLTDVLPQPAPNPSQLPAVRGCQSFATKSVKSKILGSLHCGSNFLIS